MKSDFHDDIADQAITCQQCGDMVYRLGQVPRQIKKAVVDGSGNQR